MININIEQTTLASLIAGLYSSYSELDIMAVPSELFIDIVEQLIPFLIEWDYNICTLEEWVAKDLLIYPLEMFSEMEYLLARQNPLFVEKQYGNVVLIATAGSVNDEKVL